jgi:ATP-dependent Clp protease ATP-binding subunit ClpC
MFERFTDDARRVVVLAQEEARELGHDYIGTEHLLLGLVRDEDGVGGQALEACGVTLDQVRRGVLDLVGEGAGAPGGHVPFTPRGKKVLELSLREALQLGHNYIGSEHILLGIIREGGGVAARVLEKLGVTLGGVRQEVIQILAGYAGTEVEAPGARAVAGPAAAAGWTSSFPGGALRRFGRRRRPGPQPPACSTCGGELAETAAFRVLTVRAEGGDGTRDVVIVFCTHCGSAVAGRVGDESEGDRETDE